MIITAVRDLKYSKADNSTIDLFVTCKEYGEVPTTLNMVDTEDLHLFATGTFKTVIIDAKEVQEEILIPLEEYCKTLQIAAYVKPEIKIIIPTSITMRQTRLYLLSLNLLDEVEAFVSQNQAWKIEWEYANEVLRTNQLITAMQNALNLTNEQVDTMFLEASKL